MAAAVDDVISESVTRVANSHLSFADFDSRI